MNGPETAKNLRDLGFSNMIVAVTGNYSDAHDKDHFLNAGANVLLGKPTRREDLAELVQQVIAKF